MREGRPASGAVRGSASRRAKLASPPAIEAATSRLSPALPYVVLAAFCLASLITRPIVPPDETRYLTVAWEMFLSRDWFVPTLNFEPYHHKPPLLFWLVDAAWGVLGVGRAQAMLVICALSACVLRLTERTAAALLPERRDVADRVAWIMLGNIVFLIYASLVLFDMLLTACVLAAFLALLRFARGGGARWAVAAGLLIGLGVLAKGPVVLIHVGWPIALYPLWRTGREVVPPSRFYRGAGIAFAAALVPVAIWLVPALAGTGGGFAYDLVWEQSAGRISGNMDSSHPRPFWFYLLVLPLFAAPWLLSPAFWGARPLDRLRSLPSGLGDENRGLRLLALWVAGTVATFSLISGKQLHYLLPILPPVTIVLAWLMTGVPLRAISRGAVVCVGVFAVLQAIAGATYLRRYDLSPVARVIAERPDAPVGFIKRYQGELGYLSRRSRPVEPVGEENAAAWLDAHPDGFLVSPRELGFEPDRPVVFAAPYRDRHLSVYGPAGPAP